MVAPRQQYQFNGDPGKGQDSKRRYVIFYDQHKRADFPDGRPWGGWTEKAADDRMDPGVVGELLPVSSSFRTPDGTVVKGWESPWLPEAKYIQASLNSMTGNRFKINYVDQVSDYKRANERYYRRAANEAGARNLPAPKLYGPVAFQIRALNDVGDPPKSPKLPEAAMSEDPWILGFSQVVNQALAEIMERDNGRMSEPADMGIDENPFDGLGADDMDEIKEFLAERRKRKLQKGAA